MRSARLNHALQVGAFSVPPDGTVAVLRPRAGDDLSMLPHERTIIVTGHRPDHDAFAAQGYVLARNAPKDAAMALVCVPRARALARALLSEASSAVMDGGVVVVDGEKTSGADSVHRDLRKRGVAVSDAVAKAHGKLFTFPGQTDLADWAARPTRVNAGPDMGEFVTRPGVFSADGPDRASVLLAAALPDKLPPRIADLGAGWGYLAAAALSREGIREVHLIEAEADALDCARDNIHDPRARFHWADAIRFKPDQAFDAVVCNPPFHSDRNPDPGLGMAFIQSGARLLTRHGTLWMVANRHLPYEKALRAAFRDVTAIGDDKSYAIWRADHPQRIEAQH